MTEPSAVAANDPLDRNYLERNYLALGCGDVLVDVIKIYLDSYPHKVIGLKSGLESGKAEELVKLAHGLKGESGSVGAHLVFARAAAMEQAARRGELEELRRMLPELELELARAADALTTGFLV